MPGLLATNEKSDVVALLIADLHLSLNAPLARAEKDDWLKVTQRQLRQVSRLAEKHQCPVICSGDIWDTPCPAIELVNWSLTYLPQMYAVPGNHDLKNHSLEDIRKTAFWTLVEAGKIIYLEPGKCVEHNTGKAILGMWGFPWGVPVEPLEKPNDMMIEIAVVHSYLWGGKDGHPGAKLEDKLSNQLKLLKGYDAALYGDNHSQIFRRGGRIQLLNPGAFMRRKRDEMDHDPCVGLLHSNGKITRHYLDVSRDRFVDDSELAGKIEGEGIDATEFMEELANLSDAAVSFTEALKRRCEKEDVSKGVKQIIMEASKDE